MEFFIVIMIGVILLFLLGVPMYIFLSGLCILLFISDVICFLFFVISLLLAFPTKRKNAVFKEIRQGDSLMAHAVYEVEGEEITALFPTDLGLDRFFYKEKRVVVWIRKIRGRKLLFDRMSFWIIGVGNIAFFIFGIILASMVA